MASVANDPNGRRRVLFTAPDGTRKTIRLGKAPKKDAESAARHVEHLLAARYGGAAVPRQTALWLESVGDALREKITKAGLADAPARALLGEFLESHVLSRTDVKPATLEVWRQPARNLTEFFGRDRRLDTITPGDATEARRPRPTPGRRPGRSRCSRTCGRTSRRRTSWPRRARRTWSAGPPGQGARPLRVEELQPPQGVRVAGEEGRAGALAGAVPQPALLESDRVDGAVPGPRGGAVDGPRREGVAGELQPGHPRALRPRGGRGRGRRSAGGAESGAAPSRGCRRRAAAGVCKWSPGGGFCGCVRRVALRDGLL